MLGSANHLNSVKKQAGYLGSMICFELNSSLNKQNHCHFQDIGRLSYNQQAGKQGTLMF